MKPSEVIDRALTDHLDSPDKWMQGDWEDDQGRRCMARALEQATPRDDKNLIDLDQYLDTVAIVGRTINEVTGDQFCTVAAYNDTPGRSFDEVREVLEKARAQAQEMGQ